MALENKLGITDSAQLAREEEKISKAKAKELFESGILDSLHPGTYVTLARIHEFLFDEIYMNIAHPFRDGNGRRVIPAPIFYFLNMD